VGDVTYSVEGRGGKQEHRLGWQTTAPLSDEARVVCFQIGGPGVGVFLSMESKLAAGLPFLYADKNVGARGRPGGTLLLLSVQRFEA
jgi:hypothetical protein